MIFKEERGNLFEVDKKYYLVQCVSACCAMGAGIAVEFQKKFKLRNKVLAMNPEVGDALLVDHVFNLITKKFYYGKPTYQTLQESLENMLTVCRVRGIKYLAMPTIASGLDRLSWPKVRDMIQEIFADTDIEILVMHFKK